MSSREVKAAAAGGGILVTGAAAVSHQQVKTEIESLNRNICIYNTARYILYALGAALAVAAIPVAIIFSVKIAIAAGVVAVIAGLVTLFLHPSTTLSDESFERLIRSGDRALMALYGKNQTSLELHLNDLYPYVTAEEARKRLKAVGARSIHGIRDDLNTIDRFFEKEAAEKLIPNDLVVKAEQRFREVFHAADHKAREAAVQEYIGKMREDLLPPDAHIKSNCAAPVTEDNLCMMVSACPNLQSLHISGILTPKILTVATKVTTLQLDNCQNITRAIARSIVRLADGRLERLECPTDMEPAPAVLALGAKEIIEGRFTQFPGNSYWSRISVASSGSSVRIHQLGDPDQD